MDHPGMKEQPRILGAQFQRLRHGREGLLGPIILIQRPGQDVIGVDILSDLQLSLGEVECFRLACGHDRHKSMPAPGCTTPC